jgi:DNA polymerase-3 subunit alpha
VVNLRPMRSRKGDRWAILTVQDMTGVLEALAFPEAFGRLEATLKSGGPLLLKGRLNLEDGGARLVVQEAKALDHIASGGDRAVMRVRVDLGAMDEFTLDRLKELFSRSPGPCPIAFDLKDQDGSVATLRSNQRVRVDERLLEAVRQMCGADAVEVTR